MNHQLELDSSHGDDTFAGLSYVVRGLTSGGAIGAAMQQGLAALEGRPSVSSNLAYALSEAKAADGHVVIVRRPTHPYLGYASFTSAVIDRAKHTVSGNPLGYASGRDQLAWYTDSDTEAARQRIEAAAPTDANTDQHPSVVVPSDYIVGWLDATPGLVSTLGQLEVAAGTLAFIDLTLLEETVAEAITFAPGFTQGSAVELAHSLIISTAEAMVLSRLRTMRWQGLALLGYSFNEGGEAATVSAPAGLDEHRRHLRELEAQLSAQSLLIGELAWLKPHVTTAIAIMRNELEDSLPNTPK